MASHMGHSHTVHVGLHAETRKRRRKGAVSVFTLKNFNDRKERRRNRRRRQRTRQHGAELQGHIKK